MISLDMAVCKTSTDLFRCCISAQIQTGTESHELPEIKADKGEEQKDAEKMTFLHSARGIDFLFPQELAWRSLGATAG